MRDLLRARWGDRVVAGDEVDRAAVATIVFERPEELAWLEGELFPRVGLRTAAWRAELERRDPPPEIAVVEVPLLFEAGREGFFDATVAVVADEALREAARRRAWPRGRGGPGGPAAAAGGKSGTSGLRDPQRRLPGRSRGYGWRVARSAES